MRDAQSLLEQLLSFAPEKVTAADVHAMLGTAGEERLHQLVACLVERNPAGALAELDTAARECVDFALLLEQLFCFLRDALASAAGCPADSLLYAAPARRDEVAEVGRRLGLQTVLAAMQILDQTLARLRYSNQDRILAELAVVRICLLDDLDDLAVLIEGLRSGVPGGSASAVKPGGRTSPRGRHEAASIPPVSTGWFDIASIVALRADQAAGPRLGPRRSEGTGGVTTATGGPDRTQRQQRHRDLGQVVARSTVWPPIRPNDSTVSLRPHEIA